MSWLARSIANSLNLNDDDEDDDYSDGESKTIVEREKEEPYDQIGSPSSPSSQGRGVKEDLSELTKTLTRNLWGVASFLAPPPQSEPSPPPKASDSAGAADPEVSDPAGISGIRSDFAEIGGKFRSGISMLASNTKVSEITKIASNFLQLGSEQEDYDSERSAVGVTEEVVAFVRDIAMHPETWLDFPLLDDEDDDEFDMSDAQQDHALAVERLAPSLAALRYELCPGHMSEDCFWKIYFVLVHPRLNRHDAELLSTPQIVKARDSLTQELQNRHNAKPERGLSESDSPSLQREETLSVQSSAPADLAPLEPSIVAASAPGMSIDSETEKHPVPGNDVQVIDKTVVEEGNVKGANGQELHSESSVSALDDKYEDDGDDWLKEETTEMVGGSGTTIDIENDEDVSFSDLEDDDEDVPTNYKKGTDGSDVSTKDSRDWVQLSGPSSDSSKSNQAVNDDHTGSEQVSAHNSETKESNDWLDVDDIDVV